MDLQPAFRRFHKTIRQNDNGTLRMKRDRIIRRMKREIELPFSTFNQGSYAMATGIKPLAGREYDIDVGVVFQVDDHRDYDPVKFKRMVEKAVKPMTTRVSLRRPVVTVFYKGRGQPYHVDLAVYLRDAGGTHYLAVGRRQSAPEYVGWVPSEPLGFIQIVRENFLGAERDQFRRVVRYLKRWKDIHFSPKGNAAPPGIGLTVAAFQWFHPVPDDDLEATRLLVQKMWTKSSRGRLRLRFPTQPYDDPLEAMTRTQMEAFLEKLGWLDERLSRVSDEPRSKAQKTLRITFGQEFPNL